MSLKNLFLIKAILSVIFGIAFILFSSLSMDLFGVMEMRAGGVLMGRLLGVVTDSLTQEPIAFAINNIPGNSYDLRITYIGYGGYQKSLDLSRQKHVFISARLVQGIIELGVDRDAHIQFVIDALTEIDSQLGLAGNPS